MLSKNCCSTCICGNFGVVLCEHLFDFVQNFPFKINKPFITFFTTAKIFTYLVVLYKLTFLLAHFVMPASHFGALENDDFVEVHHFTFAKQQIALINRSEEHTSELQSRP